jgi:hypothetical protein
MTSTEFRECADAIGWSQRQIADILSGGASHTTVAKWARAKQDIPENVAEWLRALAKVHRENHLPKGWKGGPQC